MTAKQWLMRGRMIEEEIDRLEDCKRETWDRITSVTSRRSDMPGSERDPHRFEAYTAFEDKINERVESLLIVKAEILGKISMLPDARHRNLLMERYILEHTLEEAAANMHYSYKQICRIHGEACEEIGKLLGKRVLACPWEKWENGIRKKAK